MEVHAMPQEYPGYAILSSADAALQSVTSFIRQQHEELQALKTRVAHLEAATSAVQLKLQHMS